MRRAAVILTLMLGIASLCFLNNLRSTSNSTSQIQQDEEPSCIDEGLALLLIQQYQEAIVKFDCAIASNQDFAFAYLKRAYANIELGNYQAALDDIAQTIIFDPLLAEFFLSQVAAIDDSTHLNTLLEEATVAVEADTHNPMRYMIRGLLHQTDENYEAAIADFEKTISLQSDFTYAHLKMAQAYAGLGKFESALAANSQAISLDSRFAAAYANRCFFYNEQGTSEQCLQEINAAIAENPDNPTLYHARGGYYLAYAHNYEQAVQEYTQAIELDPNFVDAYAFRARAYYEVRNYELAIADMTRTIEYEPWYAEAYAVRGFLYEEHGEDTLALEDYQEYIRLTGNLGMEDVWEAILSIMLREQSPSQ